MIEWKIETRNIKDLKNHPKNPRRLTKDQYDHLKTSIDKFGLIDKPIVNLDGTIIGGHQRVQVLRKDKQKTVECWIPSIELDEKQVEELLLRMNRNTGSWNYDELANLFDIPDLLDYGFTTQEFHIEDIEPVEKEKKPKKLMECPACGHTF